MRDLFACNSFSEGMPANLSADCSRRLEPVETVIHDLAANAEVADFVETGMRAVGSLHWLHNVSTRCLTWYFAHKRRGREAMDAADLLPDFRGRAVHDFWDSYLKYDGDHAFCNAHLLRELLFLWEEQDQKWAQLIKTGYRHGVQEHLAATTLGSLPVHRHHFALRRRAANLMLEGRNSKQLNFIDKLSYNQALFEGHQIRSMNK